jgi:hypothetical protein
MRTGIAPFGASGRDAQAEGQPVVDPTGATPGRGRHLPAFANDGWSWRGKMAAISSALTPCRWEMKFAGPFDRGPLATAGARSGSPAHPFMQARAQATQASSGLDSGPDLVGFRRGVAKA